MGKMRTMTHNSRTNAAGRVHGTKHNDRNFDVNAADNIDPERVHLNEYQNCYDDSSVKFSDVELRFYEEHFREQLEKINANYIKNRHPERVKTMEQFKASKQYCPEETTYQIGKMEKHVDHEKLKAVYEDYRKRLEAWNEEHGKPFTILTSALHVDEDGAPHYQDRRVWHYYDQESGFFKIGQEKALEAAGIDLPDPDKKMGRRNNRKMTFDKMARGMWLDCCHEHGLDVERVALPDGKKHNLDKEDMIREKYQAILDENDRLKVQNQELTDQNKDLKDKNQEMEAKLGETKDDLEKIKGYYKDWESDLLDLQEKVIDLEEKTDGRQQDYEALDKEASELEDKVNDLINRHDNLIDEIEDLSGDIIQAVEDKNKAVDDYNGFLDKFNGMVEEYNSMQEDVRQHEFIEARKADLTDTEAILKKPLMGEPYYQVPVKDWETALKMSQDYSKMEFKTYKAEKENNTLKRENKRKDERIQVLIKEKQQIETEKRDLKKDKETLLQEKSAWAEFCDKFNFLDKWRKFKEEREQRKEQERQFLKKWQQSGPEL